MKKKSVVDKRSDNWKETRTSTISDWVPVEQEEICDRIPSRVVKSTRAPSLSTPFQSKVSAPKAASMNYNASPPPPSLSSQQNRTFMPQNHNDEEDELSDVLMSWYYSGYYTGQYKARQESRQEIAMLREEIRRLHTLNNYTSKKM